MSSLFTPTEQLVYATRVLLLELHALGQDRCQPNNLMKPSIAETWICLRDFYREQDWTKLLAADDRHIKEAEKLL